MHRCRRVFVSYAREDRSWVRELVQVLRDAEHKVFFDEAIRAGESFPQRLRREIGTSDFGLICRSEVADGSSWVKAERGALKEEGVPVLHVNADTEPEALLPFLDGPVLLRLGEDGDRTAALAQRLRVDTLLDPDSPSSAAGVARALESGRPIVIAWSVAASRSDAFARLIDVAHTNEINSGRRAAYPLRLDSTKLPLLLSPIHAASSEAELAWALEHALVEPQDEDLRRATPVSLQEECSKITARGIAALRASGRYLPELRVSRPRIEAELESFRGGNRPLLYLVGESGSGKTDLLIHFAERCMARGDFVLRVDLGAATGEQTTSCDGLESYLAEHLSADLPLSDWIDAWRRARRRSARPPVFLLVLEGFDGVVGLDRSQAHLFAAVVELAERFPELRIVFPVRRESHERLFASHPPPRLDDGLFSHPKAAGGKGPGEMPQFVQYLPGYTPAQVDEALTLEGERRGISIPRAVFRRWETLMSSPFYLAELCDVWASKGALPSGPATAESLLLSRVGDLSKGASALVFDLAGRMHRAGVPRVSVKDLVAAGRRSANLEELRRSRLIVDVALPGRPARSEGIAFGHDRILDPMLSLRRRWAARQFAKRVAKVVFWFSLLVAAALCLHDAPLRLRRLSSVTDGWRRLCPGDSAPCEAVSTFASRAHDIHVEWVWGMHVATAVFCAAFWFLLGLVSVLAWLHMVRRSDAAATAALSDTGHAAGASGNDLRTLSSVQEKVWSAKEHWLVMLALPLIYLPNAIQHRLGEDSVQLVGFTVASLLLLGLLARSLLRVGCAQVEGIARRSADERRRLALLVEAGWRASWGSRRGLLVALVLAAASLASYYGLFWSNYGKDVLLTERAVSQLEVAFEEVEAHGPTRAVVGVERALHREVDRMRRHIARYRDIKLRVPIALALPVAWALALLIIASVRIWMRVATARAARAGPSRTRKTRRRS